MAEEKKPPRRRQREIRMVYKDERLWPRNYEMRWCDDNLIDGAEYWVTIKPISYRGSGFEKAYHIAVNRAFSNMPENEFKDHFPTADHFRHYLLCKLGYCTHDMVGPFETEEAAQAETGKRRRTKGGRQDTYILTTRKGTMVNIYESWSQAHDSTTLSPIHNKEEFVKSAHAVLDHLAEMLGCTRDELMEDTRNNA